jgi:hypothetical protein
MTYNQVVKKIQTLLESHPMLKTVRFTTPTEWIGYEEQPVFPVANFFISTGQLNRGSDFFYQLEMWFLDKSGVEGEFEQEVISDQHSIANDIILALRRDMTISIDDNITWTALSEKFEDYLSGVTLSFNLQTNGEFSNCDFPI